MRKSMLRRRFFFILLLLLPFLFSNVATQAQTSNNRKTLTGLASWYSDKFEGRRTANGEIFRQKKLTCASNHFPLNTWVRVTDIENGKSVVVWVNDRMGVSKKSKRIIDLSRKAAKKIHLNKKGLTKVKVEDLGRNFKKKKEKTSDEEEEKDEES